MNHFIDLLQTALLHVANGALAALYTTWTHGTAILAVAGIGLLARAAPPVQRGWCGGVGGWE